MRRRLFCAVLLPVLLCAAGCASRDPSSPQPRPTTPAPPGPEAPSADAPAPDHPVPATFGRRLTIQLEGGRVVPIDLDTYVHGSVTAEAWVRRDEPEDVAERVFEVQALVARTYALANRGRHAGEGFDLCARTHCQIYRPPPENGRWADTIATAVDRTRGSLIAYNGAPVLALFHANCGGGTSAAHDVWGGTVRPYLAAVEDRACDIPSAHWRAALPRDALVRTLDADRRTRVDGRLDSIDVIEADGTGRVMLVALNGARSPVVRGEELRGILGRTFGVRSVRSPRFRVHRDGSDFVFEGSGLGHGAGLCQFGATVRLRAGATAREVIEHYYPGAKVVRLRDDT